MERDRVPGAHPGWTEGMSGAHLDEDPLLAVVDAVVAQGALTPGIDLYASSLQVTTQGNKRQVEAGGATGGARSRLLLRLSHGAHGKGPTGGFTGTPREQRGRLHFRQVVGHSALSETTHTHTHTLTLTHTHTHSPAKSHCRSGRISFLILSINQTHIM